MDRHAALLLALSLVLASTAAAAPAAQVGGGRPAATAPDRTSGVVLADPPTQTENTTARLTLPTDRIQRTEIATVGPGLGSALQGSVVDARSRHRQLLVQRRLAGVDNASERRTAIDRALIDIGRWLEDLQRHERAVLTAHAEGRISSEALVRELAHVDAEARRIDSTLGTLEVMTQNNPAVSDLQTRILPMRASAQRLQGPVRHRASRVAAGEAAPTQIYVESSTDGIVLSMLDGGTYVREATYYPTLDPASGTLDSVTATERARELYPWTFGQEHASTSVEGLGREVYRISVIHPQGELVAYLDGDTEDVFRERQRLTVRRMPTVATTVRVREDTRLVLRRTYPGGPLEIRLENPDTAGALDARVTVAGHVVGRTGLDGTVRTLQPRPPYTIAVAAGETSFNVTIEGPTEERVPD